MAFFPTKEQIYKLIQQELPEGVFPDGAPEDFYSTAESWAASCVTKDAYDVLEQIWNNYFVLNADSDALEEFEKFYLGEILPAGLTLAERRDRIQVTATEQKSLSQWSMITALLEIIPTGVTLQVYELKNRFRNGWQLGVSQLGVNTFLGGAERTKFDTAEEYCNVPEFDYWTLGRSNLGVNTILAPTTGGFRAEDWFFERFRAYGFWVRIFNHTLTTDERDQMIKRIEQLKPARSGYFITDNHQFSDFMIDTVVNNINEFNNIDAAFKDAGSTTGYTGRTQ